MINFIFSLLLLAFLACLTGCVSIKLDPIHVTIDHTIRIEKEVEDFFCDLDDASTLTIENNNNNE